MLFAGLKFVLIHLFLHPPLFNYFTIQFKQNGIVEILVEVFGSSFLSFPASLGT